MHDTAPHTRYTHITNTKHIYSMPERALMSTNDIIAPLGGPDTQHLVPPGLRSEDSFGEGESVIKGRREEMTTSDSSAADAAKPRGSVENGKLLGRELQLKVSSAARTLLRSHTNFARRT
jgi:hypothetical protein